MLYYVKIVPSKIGVIDRKRYLESFSNKFGFLQAFWETRENVKPTSYGQALSMAQNFLNWTSIARIVSVDEDRIEEGQ
jgi:hypothetical protein